MAKDDHEEGGHELQSYMSLVTQHQWALRGFILSLMPGSSDVDDVLQETNLILWEKRKKFVKGTNFLAWATTVARFQVMRHRTTMKRSREVPFSDECLNDLADQLVPQDSKKQLLGARYTLNKSTTLDFSVRNEVGSLTLDETGVGEIQDPSATEERAFYRIEAE